MPAPLKKIAFVIENFALNSPGQQLLDRFVLGYPDNGEFRKLQGCTIAAHVVDNGQDPELQKRAKEVNLSASFDECLRAADAVVVVPRELRGNPDLLRSVLQRTPDGARCFVYGAIADNFETGQQIVRAAEERRCVIAAGTATTVAWRLPDVTLPRGAAFRRALIVVQGEYPIAEIEALNALLPIAEGAGQSGIDAVEFFKDAEAWPALNGDFGRLLASAVSRSDTPQGDALIDARTQDLYGMGLVPKLAKAPRCWLVNHSAPPGQKSVSNGFQTVLAVLDGVVADYNMAVETGSGKIWSWQVYRPPAPFEHVYSRLASALEAFVRSGDPPWPPQRALVTAKALHLFQQKHHT